jgi:hypothetical protein
MKFIHTYDNYKSLNEEVDIKSNQSRGAQFTMGGKKYNLALWHKTLDPKTKKYNWTMWDPTKTDPKFVSNIESIIKGFEAERKTPFVDVKDLQGYIYDKMGAEDQNKMWDTYGVISKNPPKGPRDKTSFSDGKFGLRTKFGMDIAQKGFDAAKVEAEKCAKEAEMQQQMITQKVSTVGTELEKLIIRLMADDTNDTIKGSVEKGSNRIKIKDRGDQKLTEREIGDINDYLVKNGYVLLKVVDKDKSFFHKLFGSKGMKYVWVKGDKKNEEIEKLKKEQGVDKVEPAQTPQQWAIDASEVTPGTEVPGANVA